MNTHTRLKTVGLSHLSESLSESVSERGARLSGGERQRALLARLFGVKPRIILLDEATSALDEENEVSLLRALRAQFPNTTIVAITHRLSLTGVFEESYQLKRGRFFRLDGIQNTR